jgi:neutral ceramidase
MTRSQLLVGTSVTDITPPLEVGLLTSSVNGLYEPFESVRLPLKVRVLVLKSGAEMIALVSADLLALNDTSVDGWDNFKQGMTESIASENIIFTCTHTHNAPESVALSNLYQTEVYQFWLAQVQFRIREAIKRAVAAMQPCTLSVFYDELKDFSMQRRIKTSDGIIMSDSIQPIAPELLNLQPVDRRVKTIRFHDDQGNGVATVIHAICHPVHEMCMKHISAEFPGEMCVELERSRQNGMPMFLNGAAGDTNPPTVSMGPDYAREHGIALAKVAQANQNETEINSSIFALAYSKAQLLIRPGSGITNVLDALARFSAIRIGELAIVFLPGEPFVEIAQEIEKRSPFAHTIVVAYSENNIGYIPTEEGFELGGYEAGPGKWSYLEKGTDKVMIREALRLLNDLYK